jgi:ElaB/YqjD/DUF883 family membrane-anchored ribosome-binding protein
MARTPSKSSASGARKSTASKSAPARRTTGQSAPKRQAKSAANDAEQRARRTVLDQVGERSNQAGEQLSSTASDIREIATQLRGQDNDPAAKLADAAADRVQQAGDYLANSDPDALLNDLEDLARSKPWLTAASAVVVGFAAARALSSSSRRRHGGGYVNTGTGRGFDESAARRSAARS